VTETDRDDARALDPELRAADILGLLAAAQLETSETACRSLAAFYEQSAQWLLEAARAAFRAQGLPGCGPAVGECGSTPVARQLLEALAARRPPPLEDYDVAGWYHPTEQTGGDFFDFAGRADGGMAVAMGDVSGHGVGPALVAAACQALLRATLLETDDPVQVINRLNQVIRADQLEDRFVTAFFGVLDRGSHHLDYASAGQGPILCFNRCSGTIAELPIQGFPLGLSPRLLFDPAHRVFLAPGDFLALFTDGFFEWFNPRGECYGVERMKAQIESDRDLPAETIVQRLYASVLDFVDGTPQPDDLTAVVVKRLN
jgi:phosphoserine phosphatase